MCQRHVDMTHLCIAYLLDTVCVLNSHYFTFLDTPMPDCISAIVQLYADIPQTVTTSGPRWGLAKAPKHAFP